MYSSTLSLISALDRSGWWTLRPGRFTPGKDPVPIVQEAGWAPGLVWTGAENLAPTGIRPRTVQPVASRYTNWAIPAHMYVCVYMNVCMYLRSTNVWMFVCIYVCTYVFIMYERIHVRTYVSMYVCMYICVRTYVCTHACIHTCAPEWMCVWKNEWMTHESMRERMRMTYWCVHLTLRPTVSYYLSV